MLSGINHNEVSLEFCYRHQSIRTMNMTWPDPSNFQAGIYVTRPNASDPCLTLSQIITSNCPSDRTYAWPPRVRVGLPSAGTWLGLASRERLRLKITSKFHFVIATENYILTNLRNLFNDERSRLLRQKFTWRHIKQLIGPVKCILLIIV